MKALYAQLYSVKDAMEKNYMETLRKIGDMGYAGVEFAGYGGYDDKTLRQAMKSYGLTCVGSHVSLEALEANPYGEIEFLKNLGGKYMVCPYWKIENIEDVKRLSERINPIAQMCQKYGVKLLYHNHAHEFAKDGEVYLLDRLFDYVDPGCLYQEPDLYWIAYAGVDPLAYLEKVKERSPLVHLKQMENTITKKNVTADAGIIDLKKAMEIANNSQFIYEQETMDIDPLDAMEQSLQFMKEV